MSTETPVIKLDPEDQLRNETIKRMMDDYRTQQRLLLGDALYDWLVSIGVEHL